MRLIHWNYFLALEEDLLRLARFVDFDEKNFNTFSLEMAHLLLAASSEIDVVLKMVCRPFAPRAKTETAYRSAIPHNIPDFTKLAVELPRYELGFLPWQDWDSNITPGWWTAYNKVKHQRDSSYERTNLENVLLSMAALFVCNLYLYKDLASKGRLSPWAQAFLLNDQFTEGVTPGEGGWTFICKL